MSQGGDAGSIRWIIDADDSRFNAMLDRAEARAREFGARIPGAGGAPVSTFGGAPIGGGNVYAAPGGFASAAPTRDSVRELREAMTDARRYAEHQDMLKDFARGRLFADDGAPMAGGGGRRPPAQKLTNLQQFLSGAPSGIGLLMSGMFGGWEIAKAYQAKQIGELQMALAPNEIARLQASTQMIQAMSSGVFTSSIGGLMDFFADAGPSALIRQNMRNIAGLEATNAYSTSQINLDNVQRITGIGRAGVGAVRRREAEVLGRFNQLNAALGKDIAFTEEQLEATEEYSYLAPNRYGISITMRGTRGKIHDSQERQALRERVWGWRADLDAAAAQLFDEQIGAFNEISAIAATSAAGVRGTIADTALARATIGATPSYAARARLANIVSGGPDRIAEVARQTGGLFFGAGIINPRVAAEIGAQGAAVAAGQQNIRDAENAERAQQIMVRGQIESSQLQLLRQPLAATIATIRSRVGAEVAQVGGIGFGPTGIIIARREAVNAMQRGQMDIRLARQQAEDQAFDIALNQTTRENQIGAAISGNYTGAQAIGIAGGAQARAAQLARAGNPAAAMRELALGRGELELQAQNYLRRFQGEQVGYLEAGAPSRGLDSPQEVLKTIDEQIAKLGQIEEGAEGKGSNALLEEIKNGIRDLEKAIQNLASD